MRLKVRNFGPIKKVDIDFNQLTIIIGKNNLGKSYLAQLHYTLLECSRRLVRYRPHLPPPIEYETEEADLILYPPFGIMREQFSDLGKRIKAENLSDSDVLDSLTKLIMNDYAQRLQITMRLLLERSFGIKINKLVNINSNVAKISWDIIDHLSANAQITRRGTLKVNLSLTRSGKRILKSILESSKLFNLIRKARTHKPLHFARLYREIERNLFSFRPEKPPRLRWRVRAFYIPAGRGGLLESYETVVGGLVSLSPLAPVRGLSMPPLPGMASQFYSVLLRLRGEKGPLSKIVAEAFKEMLQGDVQLRRVKGQPKSRLVYRFSLGEKTGTTDVIHAASMIKELAPICLIVQELVRPGDFLLIEEPESHLHPGAQIKFARVTGDLVSNGVNILITTHSDIFLRAIGHLAGRSRIEKGSKMLDWSSIAIYWLKDNKLGCSSVIVKLSRHGILEDIPTFDEIVKDLYEEEQELEKEAQKEK